MLSEHHLQITAAIVCQRNTTHLVVEWEPEGYEEISDGLNAGEEREHDPVHHPFHLHNRATKLRKQHINLHQEFYHGYNYHKKIKLNINLQSCTRTTLLELDQIS